MSFIVWDISPYIFEGVEFFRWYGLSWMLGVVAGYQIMLYIYKREGLDREEVSPLALYLMLGAIIGARLGHVLFYDPIYYWQNPIEILPIKIQPSFEFTGLLGLASHGGVIGALVALYLYNRRYPKGYLWLLDRLVIAGASLGGFIRLGNLMNSEIIGVPTKLPWAFVFTRVDLLTRHPAQLYEAICYFLISLVLLLWWRRGSYKQGFLFGLGMVLIFTQRFLMEFVKENQVAFEEELFLNMGQILSIPLIGLGIYLMMRRVISNQEKKLDKKIN